MKNTTENKERVFESVNKLIFLHGTGKEISDQIDEAEYCFLGYVLRNGNCVDESNFETVQVMRGVRDFFREIDEIINNNK